MFSFKSFRILSIYIMCGDGPQGLVHASKEGSQPLMIDFCYVVLYSLFAPNWLFFCFNFSISYHKCMMRLFLGIRRAQKLTRSSCFVVDLTDFVFR